MTDGIDYDALAGAVRDALADVAGVSKIVDQPGGAATWLEKARPRQSYWEVEVVSASERGAGVGTYAIEEPLVQVEGWMPWSFENPRTATTWRALLAAMKNRLRSRPTFGGICKNSRLPVLTTNNRIESPDGLLCHHAIITVACDRYFDYEASGD